MKKISALFFLVMLFAACSRSKEEVIKQEKEYDQIADSVLKASENYKDGVDTLVDSVAVKGDSIKQ